jgi:Tfp pilus assembly protein FimT
MNFKNNTNQGITLLEIILTISLSSVLVLMVVPVYNNLQLFSQLNENRNLLVQELRFLREKSIARQDDSYYGIKLTNNSYVLYKGDSYNLRDQAYDRVIGLKPLILNWDLENNSDEIIFSKGSGKPNTTGFIFLKNVHGTEKMIQINQIGKIE